MSNDKTEELAAFEAWYASLPNSGRKAGLTLLDAWIAGRAALSSAPAREPMTEREILDLVPTLMPIGSDFELLWFARAIERHHGITKE